MISLDVNGKKYDVEVSPDVPLLWVIREHLGFTGTKYGCGIGLCGSCTVVVGKEAVRSCRTSLAEVQGMDVTTIEGLAQGGRLHPLQQAFIDKGGLQCGYCTPGMIMNAYGLMLGDPHPSREKVLDAMEGNLCRCSAYKRILEAIESVAKEGGRA